MSDVGKGSESNDNIIQLESLTLVRAFTLALNVDEDVRDFAVAHDHVKSYLL